MKKYLFSLLFVGGVAVGVSAQDAFVQVLYPSDIVASYDNSFADWQNTPDMTDPNNRVIAPVMLADDGSANPNQLCNATTQDMTGHIALIVRGECEFGLKAKNAWDAGAVGVIIMNNNPGEMINMAAGANGDVVTVPAVFIKNEDGMNIFNKLMDDDSVSVLLGNKNGYYDNDLGSIPGFQANVPAQVPAQMAQNTTDFPIVFEAQIYNYGSNDATNVSVIAEIYKDGNLLYSDTSNVVAELLAGDSIESFNFTDYSGALGVGDYTIEYTIQSDSVDRSESDNYFVYPFRVNDDNIFSYAKYDENEGFTFNSGNYGPADRTGAFKSCIAYRNETNAQLGVKNVYFNASIANDLNGNAQSIEGESVIVTIQKWNDVFTYGVDSPTFDALEDIAGGTYDYDADNQNEFVKTPMSPYVMLDNNATYLVCTMFFNEEMYIGYDNETKYTYYQAIQERYLTPIADGATWYASGFTGGPMPSLTLEFFTEAEVGLANQDKLVDATIYPNPATNVINISVNNYEGNATLTITDIAGKTINSQEVNLSNGSTTVNTSNLTAGMYIVKMELADGSQVKRNIVIE